MRIALAQVRSVPGNKEKNLNRMEEVIEDHEADLFAFPETFVTGYMVRDSFPELVEDVMGESVNAVKEMADEYGYEIVFGTALHHRAVPGLLTNSAIAVSPGGEVQRYDKMHLPNFGPFEEKLYFTKGDEPRLMELGGMKVGVVICYDLFFPEICKYYAMNGASAVLCLSAGPATSRTFFERLVSARAIENALYCVYINNVGSQLNQVFFGGSHAVAPRGETLAQCSAYEEEVKLVEIDRKQIEIARRFRPTISDTSSSPWNKIDWFAER